MAIKSIDKNQEILLPPEGAGEVTSPLPSINADLKEICKKPVNGLLSGLSSPEEAPLKDSIKSKKERKKVKVVLKAAKNENRRATGVRGRNKIKTEKVTTTEVKKETPPTPEIKTENEIKKEEKDPVEIEIPAIKKETGTGTRSQLTSPRLTSPKLKQLSPLNGKVVKTEDEEEVEEEEEIVNTKTPESPTKNGPIPCSKGNFEFDFQLPG